jgi:hypothetical protein
MPRRSRQGGWRRRTQMKKLIPFILVPVLVWTAGCAELAQTVRIMNTAFIELFRLPLYCLRLPFLILQNMGPILQSAIRTAANVAPLLLFIENQTPPKRLNPDPSRPGELEESVKLALASPDAVPLLPLLERETAAGSARRFILLDARLTMDARARAAVLGALGADGATVRVVRVDGGDIAAERERFLAVCRRMRTRGDLLIAATAFNDALAAIAEVPENALPEEPGGRAFVLLLNRALRKIESDLRREG